MKLKLGDKVRDTVTGLEGVMIATTQWLNGCERITIQPRLEKDGKPPDSYTFDIQQAELVEPDGDEQLAAPIGGPRPAPTRQTDPTR